MIPTHLRSCPYQRELRLAVKIALQAGHNMFQHCNTKGTINERQEADLNVQFKGQPEDFCTVIDLLNEKFLSAAILKRFPTHIIIGEEATGLSEVPPLTDAPTWILDPVDGTSNFLAGLPFTCVSIGYCVNKTPVLGVVYAPMLNELYIAMKGYGAYRNGVKICGAARTNGKKSLSDAIVNIELWYSRCKEKEQRMIQGVENILSNGCRSIRSLGSAVLDLCYVATGRLDVVYAGVTGDGWKPWDYCAGVLIAREAGCSVETLMCENGSTFDIYSRSIVCATHDELLQECREVVCKGMQQV
jgi:fructose-1,6-bisphosphatase/inositol monophosphatase family enzyme